MRAMRKSALALSILLLLAGCAERWTRPGVSEAQAAAANAACADRSERAVPQALVWQVVEPGRWVRDWRCGVDRAGREVCVPRDRWRPPRHGWVDMNAGPRDAWRRECMREQGFTFQGYRPLRLFDGGEAAAAASPPSPPVDAPRP
jgi:hypothetical protein